MDWLSRLFEMMPVRGRLDLRCSYGAPWRIDQGPGEANEIPYHAVLAGSTTLEDPGGGRSLQLKAGDILLLPGNPRHVMHDGSGAAPLPARNRASLNFTISENPGSDERLDLLCGQFAIAPPHDRLLRSYLPPRLVVHAGGQAGQKETAAHLPGLVSLIGTQSADDNLGGRVPIRSGVTARLKGSHGRHSGAMAKAAGAVQPRCLFKVGGFWQRESDKGRGWRRLISTGR